MVMRLLEGLRYFLPFLAPFTVTRLPSPLPMMTVLRLPVTVSVFRPLPAMTTSDPVPSAITLFPSPTTTQSLPLPPLTL